MSRLLIALALATGLLAPAAAVTSQQELAGAQQLARQKKLDEAAQAFQRALDRGLRRPNVLYEFAVVQMQRGERAAALDLLLQSAGAGLRGAAYLQRDDAFAGLRSDQRWDALVQQVKDNERAYRQQHGDPDAARFITSDIDLFWSVYDRMGKTSSDAALFDEEYIEKGSPGLHGFIRSRIRSGAFLAETISKHANYYAAIRANTFKAKEVEPKVRASLRQFRAMYDDATFPDMYFVIGAMNSGGTASADGLLLGAEMFSSGPGVPRGELNSWEAATIKSPDILQNLIVHELMHFQQQVPGGTLLADALKEGTADFLASLITEGNFNGPTYAYGYAHEADLKRDFAEDLRRNDSARWFGSASQTEGRPADLGYFMGFRIAQAYYAKAPDKKAAVRTLLTYSDPETILRASAYLP